MVTRHDGASSGGEVSNAWVVLVGRSEGEKEEKPTMTWGEENETVEFMGGGESFKSSTTVH